MDTKPLKPVKVTITLDEKSLNKLQNAVGLFDPEQAVHYALLSYIQNTEKMNGAVISDILCSDKVEITG